MKLCWALTLSFVFTHSIAWAKSHGFYYHGKNTYELVDLMGFGGGGTVYKVKLVGSDPEQYFALKFFGQGLRIRKIREGYHLLDGLSEAKKRKADQIQSFKLLSGGRHSSSGNLTDDAVLMPLAKASGHELIQHTLLDSQSSKKDAAIRLKRLKAIYSQMARAVEQMRELGFAHMDVKPENFLIPESFEKIWSGDSPLILADFDTVRTYRDMRAPVGTQGYLAREVLGLYLPDRLDRYQPKPRADEFTDRYSLGMTLYKMIFGRTAQVDYFMKKENASIETAMEKAHTVKDLGNWKFENFIIERFDTLTKELELSRRQKKQLLAFRNIILGATDDIYRNRTLDGTIKRRIPALQTSLWTQIKNGCNYFFKKR